VWTWNLPHHWISTTLTCLSLPFALSPNRFHWNLMRFLPPKLHEYFETLMAEFIYLPWKVRE
jgi:hypothetical protein